MTYTCLSPEYRELYDELNAREKQYCIYRAMGLGKKESYIKAGYKDGSGAKVAAFNLEKNKNLYPIIEQLAKQARREQMFREGTELSKKVDKKAKEAVPPELDALFDKGVPESGQDVVSIDERVEAITPEEAKNAQFYRQIADGTIKSKKITSKYNANGELIEQTVVEDSPISERMKAQKEYCRILGMRDTITIGQVEANNITIMIVDATKRDEPREETPIVGTFEEVENGDGAEANSDV